MKILLIDSCLREEGSRTLELATYLYNKLEGEKTHLKLSKLNLLPLNEERLALKNELLEKKEYCHPFFDLARQFKEADILVIAAPIYDYSYPALLKLYIENITHMGITFDSDIGGKYKSLSNLKEVYYVTTSGGYDNLQQGYQNIKEISEVFFGVKKIHLIYQRGLDIEGMDIKEALDKTKTEIGTLLGANKGHTN